MDTINITILEDGTIKMDTDKISMPNHANAEGFLREISTLAGGETKVNAKRINGARTNISNTQEQKS